jgi:hypothetical protein
MGFSSSTARLYVVRSVPLHCSHVTLAECWYTKSLITTAPHTPLPHGSEVSRTSAMGSESGQSYDAPASVSGTADIATALGCLSVQPSIRKQKRFRHRPRCPPVRLRDRTARSRCTVLGGDAHPVNLAQVVTAGQAPATSEEENRRNSEIPRV